MAETITDLVIVNRAIQRLGESALQSLTQEGKKAGQCKAVYDDVVDAMFDVYQWSWARMSRKLSKVAETAENGWNATDLWGTGYRNAFALPGDRVGAPVKIYQSHLHPDIPFRNFLHQEGRIFADADALFATCKFRLAPAFWPPAFRAAVIAGVRAYLCVPLTHDINNEERLLTIFQGTPQEQGRGGLVGKAIASDVAGGVPAAPIQYADDLTTAHMS